MNRLQGLRPLFLRFAFRRIRFGLYQQFFRKRPNTTLTGLCAQKKSGEPACTAPVQRLLGNIYR